MKDSRLCIALLTLLAMSLAAPVRGADRVLALTTDFFSAGSLSALAAEPPWNSDNDLVSIHSDATARIYHQLIYVVNRLGGDNIQVIDPNANFDVVQQFSVGSGFNPQDIALVSETRAYVSSYDTNDLLEVNPATGDILGSISFAAFADGDGLCEMHRMHIDGEYLYVQVQRMFRQDWPDPWVPAPPSYLAVVDLASNQLVDVDPIAPGMQGIELAGLNPIAPMQIDPVSGLLLVPEAGQYGVIDAAGIEAVDLGSLQSAGFMATEAQLGGDLTDFALWSPTKAYASISDSAYNTYIISFNPATGGVIEIMYNPGDFTAGDLLAYPGGYLYAVDRDYDAPGIRIYDTATDDLAAGPIDTGLPPFELLLLGDPASDLPLPADITGIGRAYPNPSRGTIRLRLGQPGGSLRGSIYDSSGRLIRSLDVPAGASTLAWDGLDRTGRRVAAGVYHLCIKADSGIAHSQAISIVR
jgi:YD repeat-containing protein